VNEIPLERQLEDLLADLAPSREPDRLVPEILRAARRERRRPRWLALIKEPPMRIHSRVAVGSPTARLAYLLILVLLTMVVATGAVVTGASLLPGSTIVVAQDGSGTVTTITEAVAMAGDGHTIIVKPGTYHESIVISEDITLKGDGDRGAVVLEFTDTDDARWPVDLSPTYAETELVTYGIALDQSDAHIENITVRGRYAAAPGEIPIGAVVIDGGAPVIEKVDVVLDAEPFFDGGWNSRSAFQITGGSSPLIRGSAWDGFTRIVGPTASTPTFEGNTITAQRISVWAGGPLTIRKNTLLDGASILLNDAGGSIVEDNEIDGYISGAPDGTIIRDNTIRGGGEGGDGRPGSAIALDGSGTTIVERNEIIDSPYGIDISGSGATPQVSGNTVRGSTSTAILVDVGTAPTIEGNVIEANRTGIAVRGATTVPVITGNSFCDNETDLLVPDGSTVTLDGNTICEAGGPRSARPGRATAAP
jgi:parallel beta-helix repeat protein